MFHLIHLETLFESSQVASRYNAAEQEVEDLQVGSKPTKSLEEKSYSNGKQHGSLGYIWDEQLPGYEGIIRNHYKDSY